jgi:hypothetical protein
MNSRLFAKLLGLAASALLGGCGGTSWEAPEICEGPAAFETQLFFSRSMPGGGEVNDILWRDFLEGVIAPRLKGGFTVFDAPTFRQGADAQQIDSEQQKILIVLYENEAAGSKALQEIGQSYAARFNQSAVLRVDRRVCLTTYRGTAAAQ